MSFFNFSDGSEVEEELDLEDMCETFQTEQSPVKSNATTKQIKTATTQKQKPSEGPKLLPRRKPEKPKTLPTLKGYL